MSAAIGPVKLAAGNTLAIKIAGTTPGAGYDQLAVTGTVDVTGATLSPVIVGGFKLEYGMNFSAITNDAGDAVTGEFANFPTGGLVPVGGRLLKAGYSAGTGNDVQLTVAALTNSPDPDTIPGTQTVAEDHTLVLSTANGNPIAIGGIPGLTTDLRVTLSVNAGAKLSLGNLVGLTFVTGDGSNEATMTFTGSLAAINAACRASR